MISQQLHQKEKQMLLQENNIAQLNGLNGFWGDLWNSVKSHLNIGTRDTEQANNGSIGSRIGGWLSKILNKAVSISTLGVLKNATVYVPTPAEQLLLNPIVKSLNDLVIILITTVDNVFKTNQSTDIKLSTFNNALRIIELLRDYYASNPKTNLSVQAQQNLADQIDIMVETFETTIEDLLTGNNIQFQKIEQNISPKYGDNLPLSIIVPNSFVGTGVQYEIATAQADKAITTNAPTNNSIVVAEPTGTKTNAPTNNNSNDQKNNWLLPAILFVTALLLAKTNSKTKLSITK